MISVDHWQLVFVLQLLVYSSEFLISLIDKLISRLAVSPHRALQAMHSEYDSDYFISSISTLYLVLNFSADSLHKNYFSAIVR